MPKKTDKLFSEKTEDNGMFLATPIQNFALFLEPLDDGFLIVKKYDPNLSILKSLSDILYYTIINDTINFNLKFSTDIDPTKINDQYINGFTPLHYAILNRNIEICTKLLQHREINVNVACNLGISPLQLAVDHEFEEVVLKLIGKGANIDGIVANSSANLNIPSPLIYALTRSNEMLANILIVNNANVDIPDISNFKCRSPLMLASLLGFNKTVELLINHRADVNYIQEKKRSTAITCAIQQGNFEIVEMLVKNKADLSANLDDDISPLMYSIEQNKLDIALLLIANNAPTKFKFCNSPIHLAYLFGHYSMIEPLVRAGIDVNVVNHNEHTTLIFAIIEKKVNVVEVLLRLGADVNIKYDYEKNGLHYVAQSDCDRIASLLISYKANVNDKDIEGNTPLHIACKFQNQDMVAKLLESGAKIDEKNNIGLTPHDITTNKIENLMRGERDVLGLDDELIEIDGRSMHLTVDHLSQSVIEIDDLILKNLQILEILNRHKERKSSSSPAVLVESPSISSSKSIGII